MQPALDKPLLVQPVQQPHERNRLDIEQGRDRRLAHPLGAGDRQQGPRLLTGDRQAGVADIQNKSVKMFMIFAHKADERVHRFAKGATALAVH